MARDSFIEACIARDERALRRFCELHLERVFRWCVMLGLTCADAEEVAQDVVLTALKRIGGLKKHESVNSWLFQITRRMVANRRRTAWIRRVLKISDFEEPVFEHATESGLDEEIAVRKCLSIIPAAQAEVLVLTEIEGHSRSETAEILGIAEGTVASRLRLAKEAFKNEWEKQGIDSVQWVWSEQ